MSLSKTINYDNPSNFTFDTDLIEVTTAANLKDQVDPDELFFGDFLIKDLHRVTGGGSATGTLGNSAAITAGRLDMPNATATWNISPVGMLPGVGVGGASNIFTIRFKVTPSYSGSPAGNQYFYEEKRSSGQSRVQILHKSTGSISIEFRDSGGVVKGPLTYAWSPTSGTTYEFELNCNTTTGVEELYINGLLEGSLALAFDRDDSLVTYLQVGIGSIAQNFFMDDLQRFSTVQHVTDFASEVPRVVILNPYNMTSPNIIENGFTEAEELVSLSEVTTIPANTSVTHIINVAGQDTYWDGAAWVNSSGLVAQSNSAADINTNIAALDISVGKAIKLKSFLTTTDGVSTPTLTSLTFNYDFFSSGTVIKKCIVHGYVYDGCNVVSGATITFKASPLFDTLNNIVNINESTTTRATGYFEVDIPVTDFTGTANDVPIAVKVSFTDSTGKNVSREFEIQVPDIGSCAIEDTVV